MCATIIGRGTVRLTGAVLFKATGSLKFSIMFETTGCWLVGWGLNLEAINSFWLRGSVKNWVFLTLADVLVSCLG